MRTWDEDEVVQELAAARKRCSADIPARMPFLLILARKLQRKSFEFIYYSAESYDRPEELYAKTTVVLQDGTLLMDSSTSSSKMSDETKEEPMVWISGGSCSSSSSDEEEDNEQQRKPNGRRGRRFDPYVVAKAIFHTASREPLMKMEGSPGWKEALKQKYHILDARSMDVDKENDHNINNVAPGTSGRVGTAPQKIPMTAKAAAAAAIGGGAAAGGTSVAAGAMGYTASGIAANSVAASIMSAEAIASGGGVAAGGFTATMQSIGAVGVMASPVGMTIAAAGAIGGLAIYYRIHRRNQARKKEEEEAKAKEQAENDVIGKPSANDPITGKEIPYQRLSDEEDHPDESQKCWVVLSAKRLECDEFEYCYVPSLCLEAQDAEMEFLEPSNSTAAKGLFNPNGKLVQIDSDPADQDGWSTALDLHYDFLFQQGTMAAAAKKLQERSATAATPLLMDES